MKHTPEPWSIRKFRRYERRGPYAAVRCVIEGQSTLPLATNGETWELCRFTTGEEATPRDDIDAFVDELQLANADRICACVNACAGLDVAKVKTLLDAVRVHATLEPDASQLTYDRTIEVLDDAFDALADSIRAGGGQ